MFTFFVNGGLFMWPMLVMALIIVFLSVKNFIAIYITKNSANSSSSVNSILFWAGMCTLLGFFAHYLGIYNAMHSIQAAKDISPVILAGGYQVSLIPILSGITILFFSLILWFIFKSGLKKNEE